MTIDSRTEAPVSLTQLALYWASRCSIRMSERSGSNEKGDRAN